MATRTLSNPVIFFTDEEFGFTRRAIDTIRRKAQNLGNVLEAVSERAGGEFKQTTAQVLTALAAWHKDSNEAPDVELNNIEAQHARTAGLPVLAALYETVEQLRTAKGFISRTEVTDLLREILQTARGEATERIRLVLDNPSHPGVPGVGVIPHRLIERPEDRAIIV